MVAKLTITALLSAVKECRLKAVEDSIQQYGIPKNTKKTTDYLVLQTAVDKNHKYVAKLLINAGCRVNPNDDEKNNGWTPLALAIIRGNIEIAMLLLNKGAGPEAGNKTGLTVLHLAVRKKSLDMLRIVLCHMSINLVDSKGYTVLQTFFQVVCNQVNVDLLAMANNVKILELLLTKGASLNFGNDVSGYTAMHYAVKSKQVGLINKMIEKTGNVNVVSNTGDTPLHVLLSDKNDYKKGVLDIIKLLVRNRADINILNNQNESVLHIILSRCHANEEDFIEIIQFLVDKGANINIQNYRGESASHIAAKKKCLRVLNLFLQRQCQINLQDYEDNTIFHRLLQNSIGFRSNDTYIEIANTVLELGPALDIRNAEGKIPLDLIIQNKQSRILGRVLTENIDLNAVDDNGNAVLHNYLIDLKEKNYKLDVGYIQMVHILSSNGANVDLVNKNNETPVKLALNLQENECNTRTIIFDMLLHLLNYSNNLDNVVGDKGKTILHIMSQLKKPFEEPEDIKAAEIVDLCLRRGATINLRDISELSPLYMAVVNKQQHVVRVLLEHNADPNMFIIPSSQVTVLEWILKMQEHSNIDVEIAGLLLSYGAAIDESPGSEFSILHYVTLPNKFEMCSKLIAHSSNVNIVDNLGNSALHNLLRSQSDDSTEEKVCKVATELILKGNLINGKNNTGLTPLHLAVKQKLYKATKVLLEYHADPTARDTAGNCALHFLALKSRDKPDFAKDLKMVRLLTENGCDVNSSNNHGVTPLSEAVQLECISSVKALIKCKADVNLFTEDLLAPLHVAAEHGRVRVTEQLIKYGADVNAKRHDGKTALHIAIMHEKTNIVEILLKNGADPNMQDSDGKTSISLACWYSKVETVKRLLNSGADINVIDNSDKTPLELAHGVIRMELLRHIQKLDAANMFISHENLRTNQINGSFGDFGKEVAKLKEVKIDNQKSLADVLQMSQHKLTTFKNNEELQKHINSNDLHQQFPYYADLLKACYTRGVIRRDLLAKAKICFRELLEMPLPDICCDLMFSFLSNDNLQDLLTANRLKNKLRKRRRQDNDDDDDDDVAAPPAKRLRRVSV